MLVGNSGIKYYTASINSQNITVQDITALLIVLKQSNKTKLRSRAMALSFTVTMATKKTAAKLKQVGFCKRLLCLL